MTVTRRALIFLALLAAGASLLASCSSSRSLADSDFSRSGVSATELAERVPDYRDSLRTVSGRGRAIVSEPGNSERVTVLFSGNRERSLLEIRNSLGIEGGKLLSDGDTLLIYNRVDRYARKIPLGSDRLRSIDHLASVNILELINYPLAPGAVRRVMESESLYLARMKDGGNIYIDRESGRIRRVEAPSTSELPYSRIIYEGYGETGGYIIPRKITIFSSDGSARVTFQVRSIEINPELDSLSIDLPEDIRIFYR